MLSSNVLRVFGSNSGSWALQSQYPENHPIWNPENHPHQTLHLHDRGFNKYVQHLNFPAAWYISIPLTPFWFLVAPIWCCMVSFQTYHQSKHVTYIYQSADPYQPHLVRVPPPRRCTPRRSVTVRPWKLMVFQDDPASLLGGFGNFSKRRADKLRPW